jgi:3-oxoacyl-[acyl-carrier protein] reductase
MPAPRHAAEIFDLTGRVALVTGASGGLGRRFTEVLAANGASVVATGRVEAESTEVAAAIRAAGGRAVAAALDVTDPASIRQAFDAAERAFGPVEILVNNAGIVAPGRALDFTDEAWRHCLDVDLDGVFRVCREGASRMIAASRTGAIVNVASVLGIATQKAVLPYTVSKAAVVQLTKALALELAAADIRVNALAPGFFETKMTLGFLASGTGKAVKRRTPMRRFGAEGELDGALLLLASDASRFMTGTVVTVDGGYLLGG